MNNTIPDGVNRCFPMVFPFRAWTFNYRTRGGNNYTFTIETWNHGLTFRAYIDDMPPYAVAVLTHTQRTATMTVSVIMSIGPYSLTAWMKQNGPLVKGACYAREML